MPLDVELADLRDFLVSQGVGGEPGDLALRFVGAGGVLPADDVVAVRSGHVDGDVARDDTLALVRRSAAPQGALRLLAVDVETTGLDPRRDRLVAVGWVPIDGDRIDLAGARRHVVLGDDPGAAADIHGLTRADLAAGTPLPQVLSELRAALEGRALLAHHAAFDVGFLRAGHRSVGARLPRTPVVCTMTLQRRLLRRDRLAEWPPGALRLWQARERYGLLPAPPHDALGDAVACAELFLGQRSELGRGGEPTLSELVLPLGWRSDLQRRYRRWRWRLRRLSGGWRSGSRRPTRP